MSSSYHYQSLHVLRSHAWGGLELYSLDLIYQLMQDGLPCTLLCLPNSKVEKEASIRSIPITYSFYRIRDSQFTHIHVHQRQDLPIVRTMLIGKSETILFYSLYMSASKKMDLYHRWIYQRVNKIISSSSWVIENIAKLYPINLQNIQMIRYGRNIPSTFPSLHDIEKLKESMNAQSRLIFGTMCRLDVGKGVLDIAESLKHFSQEELNKFQIWIIGDRTLKYTDSTQNPVYEEQSEQTFKILTDLANKAEYKNTLKLIPFQKHTDLYLSAMDAFILASHEETYSLSVVDAMLMKKAVIGTKSGGTIEQIGSNEQRGYFINPKDPFSIAKTIRHVLSDHFSLYEKSKNASTWVTEQHSWKACIEQWKKLYEM